MLLFYFFALEMFAFYFVERLSKQNEIVRKMLTKNTYTKPDQINKIISMKNRGKKFKNYVVMLKFYWFFLRNILQTNVLLSPRVV